MLLYVYTYVIISIYYILKEGVFLFYPTLKKNHFQNNIINARSKTPNAIVAIIILTSYPYMAPFQLRSAIWANWDEKEQTVPSNHQDVVIGYPSICRCPTATQCRGAGPSAVPILSRDTCLCAVHNFVLVA